MDIRFRYEVNLSTPSSEQRYLFDNIADAYDYYIKHRTIPAMEVALHDLDLGETICNNGVSVS